MHILHCAPLGKSMFQEFVSRIHASGSRSRAGRVAFILPSPYLLARARLELQQSKLAAREFPRIISLDELADTLSGVRKISRIEQELLLADIVKETAGPHLERGFGKVLEFPGFIAALAGLFDELKLAAVAPDELDAALEAFRDEIDRNEERDTAIAELFTAYQERLVRSEVADVSGSYLLAIDKLNQSLQELPFDKIYMTEFSVLSPLRLRFLESLKRQVPMEIGICFEKNRPGVFFVVEPVYQALLGMGFSPVFHTAEKMTPPALAQIQEQLFQDQPLPVSDARALQILLSPNRTKEPLLWLIGLNSFCWLREDALMKWL